MELVRDVVGGDEVDASLACDSADFCDSDSG
jgi:hypothetical protein